VSFSGDTVYGAGSHQSKGVACAVDAKTGKLKWEDGVYLKCAPIVSSQRTVFTRSRIVQTLDVTQWEKTKEDKDIQWQELSGFRSTCTNPALPANGMAYIQGPGCYCPFPIRANVAMIPGTLSDKVSNKRLKGPAFTEAVPESPDKNPWQSWRGDSSRSAVSDEKPAEVPAYKKLWNKTFDAMPAASALAEGKVFTPSGSRLIATDAQTGKIVWKIFSAGELNDAPWYWQGRVYLTDSEGWVYCYRADNGKLIWSFRAAYADERIIAYGKLMSRWPVRGGVLIDQGSVYFSAGFFPSEGVSTYALDAITGELQWEKKHKDFTPSGPMALGKGVMYAPNGWGYPWEISLTGDHKSKAIGSGAHGLYAKAISTVGVEKKPLRLIHELEYVFHRAKLLRRDGLSVLPVVDGDSIYLRNTFLSGESWNNFTIGKRGALTKRQWLAPHWKAWRGISMTAIIKAGDIIFTGSKTSVYATNAADGKELWSAPVSAVVTDLAFNGGKLMVTCANGEMFCFGK
ncbi:MAG: PQQ-binding-like beta-propeller repeat protein, partial [Planctomycetes bacterium]|nr:PQQ-binding-like beta-propeller repeat protein [Planctomycetota bacterium]